MTPEFNIALGGGGDGVAPAAAHQAIMLEIHCRKMRYGVGIGIVDPRDYLSPAEIRDFRSNFDDLRLARSYPWVITADPSGVRETVAVPPSGFIAATYASTELSAAITAL